MTNPIQKAYNFFDGLGTPAWLKGFLGEIQEIIISVAFQIGKRAIDAISAKILEVAQESISNEEKFKKVFEYARTILNLTDLKDSALNLLIEALVNLLKNKKSI